MAVIARRAIRHLAVLGTALSVTAGCAATTYDASLETTPPTVATTTTMPTGTAAELLPRLIAEGRTVSELMVADAPGVSAAVARVDAIWLAARDEVAELRPDLVDAFDENVARIGRGADFRRVADVDKSLINLAALVAAIAI